MALKFKKSIKDPGVSPDAGLTGGPRYINPGPRPDGWNARRKWRKVIKGERKKLQYTVEFY